MNQELTAMFEQRLREDEKSEATVAKYVQDVRHFIRYAGKERLFVKEQVIAYKNYLAGHYKAASANSMLAAVNRFLAVNGHAECTVRYFKVQKEAFREQGRDLSREEYLRLLEAARESGKQRLFLLMQTIGATGIRIGELPFITVESLPVRHARVSLKGKSRMVLLPRKLCRELAAYACERGITQGSIFVTRSGRPLDRSNVLHEMKALCEAAGVSREKVYPHNLRHLFALTYYNAERDICHLADLLGHSNMRFCSLYGAATRSAVTVAGSIWSCWSTRRWKTARLSRNGSASALRSDGSGRRYSIM